MPIMEGLLLMLPLLGEEVHPLTDSEFIESHRSGDYHKAWENRAKIQGKIPVSYGAQLEEGGDGLDGWPAHRWWARRR